MTLTINRRGRTFYIYKNLVDKKQEHDYYAKDTSSSMAWYGKDAQIYDRNDKQVAYVYFKQRLFRKSELQICIYQDSRIEIEPNLKRTFRDEFWSFEFNGAKYLFQTHVGNKKSLFKNDNQVAAFERSYVNTFENDTFKVYANKDENPLLLTCLSIFNKVGEYNSGTQVHITIENPFGSKAPLDGKWRPSKI